MEDKFAVHYQTWKNEKATEFVIEKFRQFFPNSRMHVVSDNGSDYSHFIKIYGIDFTFSKINVFPGGRFGSIQGCYEWLKRINDTCLMYDEEWVVIFEDDVLTVSSDISFPTSDSGGMIAWEWAVPMKNLLMDRNKKNTVWGYGMCGGSIFRRNSFLECYSKIQEFKLEELSKFDSRIVGWSDVLINCFLQYFGYTYQIWEGCDDMTYPDRIVSNKACFVHGYKELY